MPAPTSVAARAEALLLELDRLIRERDRAHAIAAAHAAVTGGSLTIPQLYALVLVPLMRLTGARWHAGEEEVWEEHFTTAVVRTIVESLYAEVAARAAEPSGRTIVLAAPAEEYHDLGLRMLADRFQLAGYTVHFLGAALPLDEVVSAARELAADVVVLSASTHFHRLRLREYADSLRAALPGCEVWVGGPAFAHGHSDWSDTEVPDIAELLGDLEAEE
ncbi:MAG: cobalamin B12-binding domain-containing protein [Actinobacteria bacterium]|nr:MAG: cobalamin B12-binding domain-containing protein [Actinomycetota bacterium]